MTPSSAIPAGACDCHAHAFESDSAAVAASQTWHSLRDCGGVATYQQRMATLGIERYVLIQHAVYGTDHTVLLRWLNRLNGRARGVAHAASDVSLAELRRMHAKGIRGLRVSDHAPGTFPVRDIVSIADRLADLGWHVDLLVDGDHLADLAPLLRGLPVTAVIDHMGRVRANTGVDGAAFRALCKLAELPNCWIKVSAVEFLSDRFPDYADLDPMVAALKAVAAERLLWGTDWPHGSALRTGKPVPSCESLMALLIRWLPTAEERQKILVENPARLYGFG